MFHRIRACLKIFPGLKRTTFPIGLADPGLPLVAPALSPQNTLRYPTPMVWSLQVLIPFVLVKPYPRPPNQLPEGQLPQHTITGPFARKAHCRPQNPAHRPRNSRPVVSDQQSVAVLIKTEPFPRLLLSSTLTPTPILTLSRSSNTRRLRTRLGRGRVSNKQVQKINRSSGVA